MKRNNIYLYDCSNGSKGKNVGFCRMDVNDNSVKMLLNVKYDDLGIESEDIVDIKGELLLDGGESKEFLHTEELRATGNSVNMVEMQGVYRVVGLSLEYQKKNGIKAKVQGMLGNKELSIHTQNINRIEQIELEDTVYNVDTECLKEKKKNPDADCEKVDVKVTQAQEEVKMQEEVMMQEEGKVRENVQAENKRELIKIGFDEITTLPRECWKIMKNKFVVCGCNRYGHLAYMKEQGRYIICVPGVMNDKSAMCARRYGFKSYFPAEESYIEEKYKGYWMMSVTSNSK